MTKINKVQEVLRFGKNFLKEKDIISYDIDAKVLLMYVLNIDKVTLLTSNYCIEQVEYDKYLEILNRRAKFEPCAYIVNFQEFMSLPFYVDENVLIPRGDTEILVYEAINIIKDNNFKNVLDLCTGQGAIATSIAYYTDAFVVASDISTKALDVASKNIKTNNVSDKVTLLHSDLFENLKNYKFDLICSNPPYISIDEMNDLMSDVVDYEPRIALTDEKDGLSFYKKIIEQCKDLLNPNGCIILEIGYNQKDDVEKILLQNSFTSVKVFKDLNGHNRVLRGFK